MKKLLLILSVCITLLYCDSKPVEKPKDLIDEEVMVDILYDLYTINAMKSSGIVNPGDLAENPSKYVYAKYKIDSLQFAKSDKYYASDVDEYEKLYLRVTSKIQEEKTKTDQLLLKKTGIATPENKK